MTAQIADLPADPDLAGGVGLLAARRHPAAAGSPHVQEALLRRVHDTFCLTVMREPAGASWTELEREWNEACAGLRPAGGALGVARLYLARLVDPGSPEPAALADTVRGRLPAHPSVTPGWWERWSRCRRTSCRCSWSATDT